MTCVTRFAGDVASHLLGSRHEPRRALGARKKSVILRLGPPGLARSVPHCPPPNVGGIVVHSTYRHYETQLRHILWPNPLLCCASPLGEASPPLLQKLLASEETTQP